MKSKEGLFGKRRPTRSGELTKDTDEEMSIIQEYFIHMKMS
jgi:hypothetical protein